MGAFSLVMLAIVGGAAIALQGQFMGIMDQKLGSAESVFITYATGAVLMAVVMVLLKGGDLSHWPSVPWYALTAGALGVIVVGVMGYTIPRLGLQRALVILVASQLAVAVLVDHFGMFGAAVRALSGLRLAGLCVMILGVWLILK